MGLTLDGSLAPRPELELTDLGWPDYLRIFGMPAGLLAGGDLSAFSIVSARAGGQSVSTAMAFDHEGDCGIFNVGTLAHARRRGIATALTSWHLRAALERGCRTASIQATAMAEGIYAAAGFRDLGRFLEYVPAG
jgi:ribosomal protein S18 acetylase RimI-like enzyme